MVSCLVLLFLGLWSSRIAMVEMESQVAALIPAWREGER